ncbi:MAG: phosphohistidine phosphatase SixA [Deltaproteobacteria bacterium]|nr:phosphohistidine phosphatase SixA [Deltaproteobacteria bacterium]
MKLYLVRHGQANPESVDPGRSLSERGLEESVAVGKFLSSLRVKPDYIFTSQKLRAVKTAEIIAGIIEYDKDRIVISEELVPNAYPEAIGGYLTSFGPLLNVIVIGHLPSIGMLASYLITPSGDVSASISFETGGVAYLEGDDAGRPGGFVLKTLISPWLI